MASAPAKFVGDGDTTHADVGMTDTGGDGEHTVRRRAAENAAQAAEARAAAAAAEARSAIAAAARAAAMADAAAQEAERADVAVREAARAETRAVAAAARQVAPPQPRPTPRKASASHPAPAPRTSSEDLPVREASGGAAPRDGAADDDTARHRSSPLLSSESIDAAEVVAPSPNGRAARRRAATADTTVFAPVTGVFPTVTEVDGERRSAVAPAAVAPAVVDPVPAATGQPDDPTQMTPTQGIPTQATPSRHSRRRRRGLFSRPGKAVLVTAVAGGVLTLAGVLFAGNVVRTTPQPAAVIESVGPGEEGTVPVLPGANPDDETTEDPDGVPLLADTEVDTLENRSANFLQELRDAGVPTSRDGQAETEAADLVCNEIEDGVDDARIARSLTTSLTALSQVQAADLVDIARENYC